jgi:Family of unknown function (DUF6152)
MRHQRDTDIRSRRGPVGLWRGIAVGTVAILIAVPCAAHHSMAEFDPSKPVTLHGIVKELQWTNPHCFLQMLVPTGGSTTEWSVEMAAPALLYRGGLRPGSFLPGDKVTVVVAPLRSGAIGGLFLSAIAADGKPVLLGKPRP